jgi:DNA-binding MarR family transcriptional regulator
MGSHTSRQASRLGDTQAVLDAVRRIVHALRASSRWAEHHVGLSGAQLFVLQKLDETTAMSVNELAERTHTHQSSVSTVVSRLVEKGLVRRTRSATDGRQVALTLTPRGQRVVGGAPDVAQERLIRGIDQLTSERRSQLAATLGDLAQAMDADDRAPSMFFEDGAAAARRLTSLGTRTSARTSTRTKTSTSPTTSGRTRRSRSTRQQDV